MGFISVSQLSGWVEVCWEPAIANIHADLSVWVIASSPFIIRKQQRGKTQIGSRLKMHHVSLVLWWMVPGFLFMERRLIEVPAPPELYGQLGSCLSMLEFPGDWFMLFLFRRRRGSSSEPVSRASLNLDGRSCSCRLLSRLLCRKLNGWLYFFSFCRWNCTP